MAKKQQRQQPVQALDQATLQQLFQDLMALGAAAPIIGAVLQDIVSLFKKKGMAGDTAKTGLAVQCGPDGCDDCGECLCCALHCQAHALAAVIQAHCCLEECQG